MQNRAIVRLLEPSLRVDPIICFIKMESNMKKVLFELIAILGLSLALLATGCGGGGGGDDDDYAPSGSTTVPAQTESGGINGSEVFVNGRTVQLWVKWACDHEVTQAEYQDVMGSNPSRFSYAPASGEIQENRPVENVSWYDALVYCNKRSIAAGLTPCYTIDGKTEPDEWGAVPTSNDETWNAATCNFNANGYRLPTEAEWEYLARGGNISNEGQTTYSGSGSIDGVAWYFTNSGSKTHEVKKKSPNALGLYDMSGNVWEWCWDWYGNITTSTPSYGSSEGIYHAFRGGAWSRNPESCSVYYRGNSDISAVGTPSTRSAVIGFRVVRSAE